MNSLLSKNIIYSKVQIQLFFVFVLIGILNFANYSFLNYNFSGIQSSNSFLLVIRNLRPVIPLIFLFYLCSNRLWRLKISNLIRQNMFVFLLCFIFIANSIISSNGLNSFLYSVWLFTSIVVIALTVKEANHIIVVLRLLKLSSLITLVIVLFSFPILLESGGQETYFSSKTYYAYALLIYFLAELFIFQCIKINKHRIFRLIVLFLILIALFASGRRAPTICAIIALAIYLFNYSKFIFVIIISLLTVFGTTFISNNFFGFQLNESMTYKRIIRVDKSDGYKDSSYSDRKILWNRYLENFDDSPIIGKGLDTSTSNLEKYNMGYLDGFGYHNTFLQILVESGIIGFIFFLIFLNKVLFNFFVLKGKLFLLYSSILSPTLIINWVETNFLPGQVFFVFSLTIWFLLKLKIYNHEL